MEPTRVAIHGAAGRMGRRLIALGSADPQLKVVAALESASHPDLGQDAGVLAGGPALGVLVTSELATHADAMIDFSAPAGAESAVKLCVDRRIPLVMATTGLTQHQRDLLMRAAESIPLVWSPNMSLAVNLTMKLVEMAARALVSHPSGADVEIVERHHRFKEDAPSGTALRFGEIIAEAMGQTVHRHGREGQTGKRLRHEIGYHALRTGDNPGEHTIVFGLLGETIELAVKATSRDCYAVGALAAARFIASRPAGLYSMFDVLGL